MNFKIQLIVFSVRDLVITERNVADNNIKRIIIEIRLLKPLDLNTFVRVDLLRYSSRNTV